MMTKKYSFLKFKKTFTILIILFLSSFAFCAEQSKWIIAAQKFNYTGTEKDSVKDGISRMIPERILEKVSKSSFRTIFIDEQKQRELYELKNKRTSLFLQLSGEIQKRDSYVLYNYSEKEMKKKITESESKIAEIKKQINENLEQQNIIFQEIQDNQKEKKVLLNSNNEPYLEKIEIYNNDYSSLFETKIDYTSYDNRELEKELVNKNIQALLTGSIKAYGEYLSITVDLYTYPGANKIASVTEYGSLDEADVLAELIVRELSPYVTNSFPIKLKFNFNDDLTEPLIYVDDILQKDIPEYLILNSGVHTLDFICKDFVSAHTIYYFEGNTSYEINVNLQKQKFVNINFFDPFEINGTYYANGAEFSNQVEINGNPVLCQFIGETGISDYFILNPLDLKDDVTFSVKLEQIDTNENIEKRRRWMYTSYSILITSLIPTFYLNGQADSYIAANSMGYIQNQQSMDEAKKIVLASNISTGISIGCGIWFVYELVRYLYTANKVLPKETVPIITDSVQEYSFTSE